MIAQQTHQARSSETASDVVQPMAVRLTGTAKPLGYRLSGLMPGRPYCLSSPEDCDETTRQVRAYFGHVDFWEPV